MKGQFSFKFGTSASNRLSEVELPTAMSSNTSIATHQPSTSSTSLAPVSTKQSSRSTKSKSSQGHSTATSNKATTSGKKLDFKDTKSLKSVKSEGSNVSYFGAFTNNTTSDEVIKANKKSSKSSGQGLCSMNKRYNESQQPVYRGGQSRPRSRFSLRNLLYSNPLRSNPFLTGGGVVGGSSRGAGGSSSGSGGSSSSRAAARQTVATAGDTGSEGSWMDRESQGTSSSTQHHHNQDQTSHGSDTGLRECVLCLAEYTSDQFPLLLNCSHLSCIICLQQYVRIEVQEGRANLKCPQCSQLIHPNDIEFLIGADTSLYGLYQFLMVRRVLAADPDTRWCPAPNCTFAVIAAGCASCPKIDCEREGCNFSFCYHCKAEWHPNITCDQARAKRHPVRSGSEDSGVNGGGLEVKVCPRCSVLIVKMDDGSCNHMTCAVCGSEFCWLCMKEISDLHYLSPSGCTFWGKKPWSRKKKLLWQLGTIVGAPVGIALIAGISIPAMVIGIPVWVGRRIKSRHTFSSKPRRVTAIAAGVVSSVFVSPILAGLVVCVGVPCLLAYVYGVVPFSLCRSGGCGLSTTTQGVRIDVDEENCGGGYNRKTPGGQQTDVNRQVVANPSIGELSLGPASLSMGSGSHLDRLAECDRESASNTAIAGYSLTGSVASSYLGQHRLEVGADVHPRKKFSFSSERLSETVSLSEKSATVSLADNDGGASTRALAGSIIQYRMENTSVNSYKTGQATPGSSISAGHDIEGVSYRPDTDMCLYPSGDEISVRSVPGMRSLSPVHGEDVSAALRRSRGRRILEKQQSETSGNDDLGSGGGGSQGEIASDRVRFDSHISYLDTSIPGPSSYLDTSFSCLLPPSGSSAPLAAAAGSSAVTVTAAAAPQDNIPSERARLVIKKGDLDPETLREETAEELALVVSPITPRARSVSPLTADSPVCSLPQILEQPVIQIDESLPLSYCVTETSPRVLQHLDLTITDTSSAQHEEECIQDQSNISLVLVDGQSSNNSGTSTHIQRTQSTDNSIIEGTPVHESTLVNEDVDSPRSITNLLEADDDGHGDGGETTVYTSCLSQQNAELPDTTVYTSAHNSISINVSGSNNN